MNFDPITAKMAANMVNPTAVFDLKDYGFDYISDGTASPKIDLLTDIENAISSGKQVIINGEVRIFLNPGTLVINGGIYINAFSRDKNSGAINGFTMHGSSIVLDQNKAISYDVIAFNYNSQLMFFVVWE